MCQHLRTATPIAAKQYTCEICRGSIEKAERHVQEVSLVEGEIQSVRLHNKCSEAAREYMAIEELESYDFGEIKEWMEERNS